MSLSRNTAANIAGRVCTIAFGIVLIPIYVNILGIESYGLVGFFGTLQALFTFIDFGLGAAFSREVARLSALGGREQEQRDLFATFNVIYAFLATIVAVAIWFLAPIIATKWVHAGHLSTDAIMLSVRLMGITVGLQFPIGLYQGGLLGLERQVAYNVILVATTTVRNFGVIVVLLFISPTIVSFFVWQVLLTIVAVIANWIVLDRVLPNGPTSPVLRLPLVFALWGYAAGWAGNTIGIAIAQQSDKVILSRTLSLEQFGYYTLAGTVASLLWTLVHPVTSAAFPRFNQRVAVGDERGLADEYDKANQLLATILIPVSAVILLFARDIMTIWTRKAAVAAATENLVILFALGMTLIGLVNVALHVALSHGWFRLTLGFTWGTALISAPLFWICSRRWGMTGAAVVWCGQNAAYLLLIPLLHRRYIRGGGMTWLRHALVLPACAALLICGSVRLIAPSTAHPFLLALTLICTWGVTTMVVALIEPSVREQLLSILARKRAAFGGT
jgi:O-antigen/teichoic acid export membrane protein